MILVYGTVCLDRINRVPHLPAPGRYVEVSERIESAGGEALNTAVALVRLGEQPELISNSLGSGPDARDLASKVTALGIKEFHAPPGTHDVPVCEIYVTPDGERTMFGFGFAEMENRSDPRMVLPPGPNLTTVDSNHGRAGLERIRLAREAGHVVYAMDLAIESRTLSVQDFWQTGAGQAGGPGQTLANLDAVAKRAENYGVTAIITDGSRGCFVARPGQSGLHLPAFSGIEVRDTTGAGDAFRAGVLYGLLRSWGLGQCLLLGAAVGALNCRGEGAVAGLPSLEEAEELIAGNPAVSEAHLRLE